MAPMSLMTYEDARPWARAVKRKTASREMPPWGADPTIGKWANDPSLTSKELETIAAWVDGGAPEGNRADLPEAPQFAAEYSCGRPIGALYTTSSATWWKATASHSISRRA